MKDIPLAINRLEMVSFDPQKFIATMRLTYNVNGETKTQVVTMDITKKAETLTTSIINFVKSQANQDIDEDNLIDTLFVKHFHQEERVEERLNNHFAHICEKVRFMKINKNHADYMKFYHTIQDSHLVL